jgi:hypothetical protein
MLLETKELNSFKNTHTQKIYFSKLIYLHIGIKLLWVEKKETFAN